MVDLRGKSLRDGPWAQSYVEAGAAFLIAVPFGGVLILGERVRLSLIRPFPQETQDASDSSPLMADRDLPHWSIIQDITRRTCLLQGRMRALFRRIMDCQPFRRGVSQACGQVGDDGTRWLLADHLGWLRVLVLETKHDCGEPVVTFLSLEKLGRTSQAAVTECGLCDPGSSHGIVRPNDWPSNVFPQLPGVVLVLP